MALIACRGCGERISQQAASCPKCGHPMRKPKEGMSGCGLFFLIVAAIVAAAIILSLGL